MNSSLATADLTTHLKVVFVALFFSTLMVWAVIASRVVERTLPPGPRLVQPVVNTNPAIPQIRPLPASASRSTLS